MKRKIVLILSLVLTAIMSFSLTACITTDSDDNAATSYLYSFTLVDENHDFIVGEATFSAEGKEDVTAVIENGITAKVSLFFNTTYTVTVDGYEPATVTIDADGYESAKELTLVKIVPKVTLNVTATDQTGATLTPIVTPAVVDNNYVIGETYTVTVDGYNGQSFTFVAEEGANVSFVFVKYTTLNVTATNQIGDVIDDIVIKDADGNVITDGNYVYGETYYVTSNSYADQAFDFVANGTDVSFEFTLYANLTVEVYNQLDELVADIVIKDADGNVITDGVYVYGETYYVTSATYAGQTAEFVAGSEDVVFGGANAFIKYLTVTINTANQDDVVFTPIVTDANGDAVSAISGETNKFLLVAGEQYFVTVNGTSDEPYSFTATSETPIDIEFNVVITTVALNVTATNQLGDAVTDIVIKDGNNNVISDGIYTIGETYYVTSATYAGQTKTFVAGDTDVNVVFTLYVTLEVVAKDQTGATLTAVVSPSVTDNNYVVGETYTVTVDGYDGQEFTFTAEEGADVVFDEFITYVTLEVVAQDQTGATLTAVVSPSVTDNKYVVGTTYTVTVDGYAESFTFTANEGADVVFDEFITYITLNVTAKDQTGADVADIVIKDSEENVITDGKYVVGATYTVTSATYAGQIKTFVAGNVDVNVEFTLYVTVTINAVDQNGNTLTVTVAGTGADGNNYVVGNEYVVTAEGCKGSFSFTAEAGKTSYEYSFYTNDTAEYVVTLVDGNGEKLSGEVTFASTTGNYAPAVELVNGKATVILEYNTTYNVTLTDRYFSAQLNVSAEGTVDNDTVTLYKKVIDLSAHPEMTYVNDTISYNGLNGTKDIALLDNDIVYAEMFISHSVPANTSETFGVGMKVAATGENHTYGTRFVPAGDGDNKSGQIEWQLRKMNGGWNHSLIPGSEGKTAVTYKLIVAIKDATVYAYILDAETNALLISMTQSDSNYKAFNMMSFYDKTSNTVVSDIKLYNYIPEIAIEYTESDAYNVTTKPTTATFGSASTIVIEPTEGKAISNVVVKGATTVVDVTDGVWTIDVTPVAYGQKISVEISSINRVTANVVLPEENDFYTVTANSTITTGYKLNITVTPKADTTVITAIYVDGVKVVDGASATFLKLDDATSHVITVDYENTAAKVNLTLATDGYTNPIEDDKVISQGNAVVFTEAGGTVVNATIGANGLVNVVLPFGDWTVSIPDSNYRTQTLSVTSDETLTITKAFVYELFDATSTDSYISNGYKVSVAKTKQSFKDSDILYAEMTVKAPADSAITSLTGQTGGQVIGFRTAEYPTNYSTFGIVAGESDDTSITKSDIYLRFASGTPKNWNSTTKKDVFASDFLSAYNAGTLKIGVLIKGGDVYPLVGIGDKMYIDDCWTNANYSFTNITHLTSDLPGEYSNIRFAKSFDAVTTLGYGLFDFDGFNETTGWTVSENADGTYNASSTSTLAAANKLYTKDTSTNAYAPYTNTAATGIYFTENSEISFDITMTGNTSDSGVGWWTWIYLRAPWSEAAFQFCSWSSTVRFKNGGTEVVNANGMTSKGATRVTNGDGTYTWKFSMVIKADENGNIAFYNSNGALLYSTGDGKATAYEFGYFNNIFFGAGESGSKGSFVIENFKITNR